MRNQLVIVVMVGFVTLVCRLSETRHKAAALQTDTLKNAITSAALTAAKRSEPTDTVTLPKTIEG